MTSSDETRVFSFQTCEEKQSSPSSHSSVFSEKYVRVQSNQSTWIRALSDRLEYLTNRLKIGWDGYAGRPVSFHTAHFVANLLERVCIDTIPAPDLVPGSDGSLQIEWHLNGYDIELDVIGAHKVVAYRFHHESGTECEHELTNDFTIVLSWIKELQPPVVEPQKIVA